MEKWLGWSQRFENDEKLKDNVNVRLNSQAAEFYNKGIKTLFVNIKSALSVVFFNFKSTYFILYEATEASSIHFILKDSHETIQFYVNQTVFMLSESCFLFHFSLPIWKSFMYQSLFPEKDCEKIYIWSKILQISFSVSTFSEEIMI